MSQILKSAYVEKQVVGDEELALINAQALTPRTAESVFAFRICACDNQIDRDLERFTEHSLEQMAKLFVGKPVLRDHNWSAYSQTARVYAADVDTTGDIKRLILRAYMPRTDRSADTITDLEAGILREASVGVSMGRHICSVCGEDYCDCRHFRGEEYDGKRCYVSLDDVQDAYEVSLVAVPAQPGAGVCKRYEGKETAWEGRETNPEKSGVEEDPDCMMAEAIQQLEEYRFGGM